VPEAGPDRPRPRGAAILLVVALAVGVVLVDQLTKLAAISWLTDGVPVRVLGPVAGFQLERNSGAAYSLGAGYTWIFAIVAAAVAVFLIVATRRIRSLGWATVFGLLLGGTVGNLADRLFREPSFGMGHVVDFIAIPWLGFVCNVADIAITGAMVAFVILILLGRGLDGSRRRDAEATGPETDGIETDSTEADGTEADGTEAEEASIAPTDPVEEPGDRP